MHRMPTIAAFALSSVLACLSVMMLQMTLSHGAPPYLDLLTTAGITAR